jgi:hypothetical protein
MPRKGFTVEQIINHLREADVLSAMGHERTSNAAKLNVR